MDSGETIEKAAAKSIGRGTLWLAASGALGIANSLLIWMLLARMREPAEVGQFAVIMGLYTVFMTICTLGLTPFLASEFGRREERSGFLASAAALIGGWSVVCGVGLALAGRMIDGSPEVAASSLVLSIAMVPTGLIAVAESYLMATGRFRRVSLTTAIESLLRAVVPVLLLLRGASLTTMFAAMAAIRCLVCLGYAVIGLSPARWWALLREVRWDVVREIRAVVPTFAGVTVLAALHWQIAIVLTHELAGEVETARYGVASRFLVPVTMLLMSHVNALQPVAGRLASRSSAELGLLLSGSLRMVIGLSLPLAIVAILLGKDLLRVLFGENYVAAYPAFALLGLSVPGLGMAVVAARGLVALGRQRMDLLANLLAVAVAIPSGMLLIPRYGAAGAALAHSFSVGVMAAVIFRFGLPRSVGPRLGQILRAGRWPLLLLAVLIWYLRPFGLWWDLVLGGVAWVGGLLAPGGQISGDNGAPANRPRILMRILMIGAHPARTIGGISTLIDAILRSPLVQEYDLRHLVTQMDEAHPAGKLWLALTAYLKFLVRLAVWHPHLIYVHLGGNRSLYRKLIFIVTARAGGFRVLTHFHAGNFDSYYARQPRVGRWLLRWGLGRSDRFLAVSHDIARLIDRYWPGIPVGVAMNGVDTRLFVADRSARDERDEESGGRPLTRILFVGKMGFLKGEEDLLRAVSRLIEEFPELRLDLVGQRSEGIEDLVRRLGVGDFIERIGPVAHGERIDCYRRADLFVLPTYAEGMSMAVLEALASGLPVLTTRVGGNGELIEDGREGYLVEAGDLDALVDRLRSLLSDSALRRQMGARAREKSMEFDQQRMLAHLGAELAGSVPRRADAPLGVSDPVG